MLWITVFLALIISLAALAYVLWPLIDPNADVVVVEDDRLTELISRKDALLSAIKDLEFDYQVGKLSEEDYQRFNQRLRRQAVAYIQQIEKLAPETASLDEALEAEIARQRQVQDGRSGAADAKPARPGPRPQKEPATPKVRFCTNCGQPVEPTHKFCANCGTPVASSVLTPNG